MRNSIYLFIISFNLSAIGFDAVNIFTSPSDLSLSGAGVASKNSIYNNPAISSNKNSTICFSTNKWIQNFSGNSFFYSKNKFRLSFNSIGVDDIKVYNDTPSDSPLDIIGSHYLSFGLSKGFEINNFRIGIGSHFQYSQLFTEDLYGLTFDIGMRKIFSDNFRIGFLAKNLAYDNPEVPQSYTVGLSYSNSTINTELLVDYSHSSTYDQGFHLGIVQKIKIITINLGYSGYEARTTLSSGLEVDINKNYKFLYSILSLQDSHLGLSHYFGIEISI
jgi:hypothetical protein